MYLLGRGGRGSMLHTFQIRSLLPASPPAPLQPALTPTSPHPSLCDPPPTTLLTRLAAWTAGCLCSRRVPSAATVLSASHLHPGSPVASSATLALEAPLPPPKDPGSSTLLHLHLLPCTALGRGGGARSPYSQRLVRGSQEETLAPQDPAEPPPQAPGAQVAESPPARSALNWAEEPLPRQLFASRERRGAEQGSRRARRRRGVLHWPNARARRSGPQLQTSWAAVGAGRGVADRWRPARSEAPPPEGTGLAIPPGRGRPRALAWGQEGGARAESASAARGCHAPPLRAAPRSLFLALFSSDLFARTQTSSTARTLTIVFGKRGIEGAPFCPFDSVKRHLV